MLQMLPTRNTDSHTVMALAMRAVLICALTPAFTACPAFGPPDGLECTVNSDDKPCPNGTFCDVFDGGRPTCRPMCNSSADCPELDACYPDTVCRPYTATCSVLEDCLEGFYCALPNGQCLKYPTSGRSTCTDEIQGVGETDVDCGGPCEPCVAGKGCIEHDDCASGSCTNDTCDEPTCDDSLQNGAETDVNCGGTVCDPCANGRSCEVDSDCQSNDCADHICNICGDGVVRGAESCDDSNDIQDDCPYPEQACTVCGPNCQVSAGIPNFCGDGDVDDANGELCDSGAENGDAWSASPHCNSTCTSWAPYCGDGQVHSPNEQCESSSDCPAGEICRQCGCVLCDPTGEYPRLVATAYLFAEPRDIALHGDHVYVTMPDAGLAIIDVSDPSSPGTPVYVAMLGLADTVAVSEEYVYVAVRQAGLAIVDVSDPTNPGSPAYVAMDRHAAAVVVSEAYAYVATYKEGFAIIDVSDPLSPRTPVYGDGVRDPGRLAVAGSHAFLAAWYDGFVVIDVSNPTSPGAPLYVMPAPNDEYRVVDVAVSGSYAYVASHSAGLAIVDVSDPSNPGAPVFTNTVDYAMRVTVDGAFAYVASNQPDLTIIDVSNPTAASVAGSYDSLGVATGLVVGGEYAYVMYQSTLAILERCAP